MKPHLRQTRRWRRSLVPVSLVFLIVGTGLVLHPAESEADVIRLRTGQAVKGRVVEDESDPERLVIIDYTTGAKRVFRWSAVDPVDKDRLFIDLEYDRQVSLVMEGVRIVQRLNDGSTNETYGIVEREDNRTLWLRTDGQVVQISKDTIVEQEPAEVDAREVYTPDQLMQRYYDELRRDGQSPPDGLDANSHWSAASYAEDVAAFEAALLHYKACAEDPEFVKAHVAAKRVERVEALLRDQEALDQIRHMKRLVAMRSFRRLREAVEAFKAQHGEDVSEGVSVRFEQIQKDFEEKRFETFRHEARIQYPRIVEDLIEDKIKEEKDAKITDIIAWTRKDLVEGAWEALAAKMQRRDDVSPEEALYFWENRKKRVWRRAGFGAGTFIIRPAQVKPASGNRGGQQRRGGGGGGAARQQPTPKPPTRDGWWAQASTKERTDWIFAYFVMRSGLFEVSETQEFRPCQVCNGRGLQERTATSGGSEQYLCTRCGGSQMDLTLKWR